MIFADTDFFVDTFSGGFTFFSWLVAMLANLLYYEKRDLVTPQVISRHMLSELSLQRPSLKCLFSCALDLELRRNARRDVYMS